MRHYSHYALLHANGMNWENLFKEHEREVLVSVSTALLASAGGMRKSSKKEALEDAARMIFQRAEEL